MGNAMSVIEKKVLKVIFGETLVRLADAGKKVALVDADLRRCSGGEAFAQKYPSLAFNVGIAEQNAIGMAGGLASMGYRVFASTFAVFASMRACDQVRNIVGYNNLNVTICGTYAGLTTEENGATHISSEDMAIMRSIPGLLVLEPTDGREFEQMLAYSVDHEGPIYLRIPKALPDLLPADYQFKPGKGYFLRKGKDVTIIASGITAAYAIEAAQTLSGKGIDAAVACLPTLKPIDRELVMEAAKTGRVVTVENHSIIGGLGGAVAEVMAEEGVGAKLTRLGIPDCYGECALLPWLTKQYEIDSESIVNKISSLL